MLRGLGFVLAGGVQIGNEGKVNVQAVVAADVGTQLADGFEEGQTFDVAHRAADFYDGHIGSVIAFGKAQNGTLDFIGDMGNHLHGTAEIVAAAFLVDDVVVDASGGSVVVLGKGNVEITFVVAEIEVGFRAVIGHIDFAVLEGVHGAGVDVDVGVELLNGHGKAAGLQQSAKRSRGQSLTERGKHTAGNKNEFGFHE